MKGDGNSYTTEFRQYDPRLGRWASLDPMMANYSSMSPYCAFNNNPVYFTDPLGLEGEPTPDQKRIAGWFSTLGVLGWIGGGNAYLENAADWVTKGKYTPKWLDNSAQAIITISAGVGFIGGAITGAVAVPSWRVGAALAGGIAGSFIVSIPTILILKGINSVINLVNAIKVKRQLAKEQKIILQLNEALAKDPCYVANQDKISSNDLEISRLNSLRKEVPAQVQQLAWYSDDIKDLDRNDRGFNMLIESYTESVNVHKKHLKKDPNNESDKKQLERYQNLLNKCISDREQYHKRLESLEFNRKLDGLINDLKLENTDLKKENESIKSEKNRTIRNL